MTKGGPRAKSLSLRNIALSDEAIDWTVRLGSGSATAADRAAFEQWRARSPAHAQAAREAAALLSDAAHTQVAAEHRDIVEALCPPPPARYGMSRRVVLAGGMAAASIVAVASGGVIGPMSGLLATHATRVGQRKRVELADGSIAWLNTATALSVDFSARQRRLTLHNGEALFEVAKDKARPFIVSSGGGEARAVGTVYSVRRRGALSDVVVSEGVVEVRNGAGLARLAAGQRVAYGDEIMGAIHPADGQAATAWARGKLIFHKRPLASVAAELERYQSGRVIIVGDRLKQLQVTGVFDLDAPDVLLRSIAETASARVTRLPLLIVIR